MSFLPGSPSSASSTSITGASSLIPLLTQSSSLTAQLLQTRQGAALLASSIQASLDSSDASSRRVKEDILPNKEQPTQGHEPKRVIDGLPFSDFVGLVRHASPAIRACPITRIESFQKGGQLAPAILHRYILISVVRPHSDGDLTYIKLHLLADPGTFTSHLRVEMSDDRAALTKACDRRLIALSISSDAKVAEGGPSLDAVAALLAIVERRAGRYDLMGRNCLWMADVVIFAFACKFDAHWLAGQVSPEGPVTQYIRKEVDLVGATTECFFENQAPKWVGFVTAAVMRMFQPFSTHDEVTVVVNDWNDFVDASGRGVGNVVATS